MKSSKRHIALFALFFLTPSAEALDPVDPPFSPMDVEDVQMSADLLPGNGQNTNLLVDWHLKASFSADQPGIDPLQDDLMFEFYPSNSDLSYGFPPPWATLPVRISRGCWQEGGRRGVVLENPCYFDPVLNDYVCEDTGPDPCTILGFLLDGNGVQIAAEDLLPGASGVIKVDDDPDFGLPSAYRLKLNLPSAGLLLNTMSATDVKLTIGKHSGSKRFSRIRAKTDD